MAEAAVPRSLGRWQCVAVVADDVACQAEAIGDTVFFGVGAKAVGHTDEVDWIDHTRRLPVTGI